jgi:hypothetical protein
MVISRGMLHTCPSRTVGQSAGLIDGKPNGVAQRISILKKILMWGLLRRDASDF